MIKGERSEANGFCIPRHSALSFMCTRSLKEKEKSVLKSGETTLYNGRHCIYIYVYTYKGQRFEDEPLEESVNFFL